MFEASDIPGAAEVVAWFGYWPTFHDAEVLSIVLDRSGVSKVAIHTFNSTAEVDANGRYVSDKHAVVTFCLEEFPVDFYGIDPPHIGGFNNQNVLYAARVNKVPGGYQLALDRSFGVGGEIHCGRMSVNLTPGIPPDSVYLK